MRKLNLKIFVTPLVLLLCLHLAAASFNAQEAYKVDEVINPRCDLSEVPQVTDLPMPLFKALNENKEAQAAIIVYGMEGHARVYAKDVRRWLSESRGVDPQRLVTLYGGSSDKLRLELWLVPQGASLPKVNPVVDDKNAIQFDSYAYQDGESCDSNRLPALNEFAEVLKQRLDWHGYIVVRPHRNSRGVRAGNADWDPDGYLSPRQASRRAARDKQYLIKKFNLPSTQLKAMVGDNDTWTHAELWLVPPGAEPPGAKNSAKGR